MVKEIDVHLIKQYENKKLYDVNESKFVNLGRIETLVLQGKFIKVMNHEMDDITLPILIDCFSKQTKLRLNGKGIPNLDQQRMIKTMRKLIRSQA